MATTPESDLERKLRLEAGLHSKAKSLSIALSQRIRRDLGRGAPPDLRGPGVAVLEPTLLDHYDKVSQEFDHDLTDQMPTHVAVTETERELIRSLLDAAFVKRSAEISKFVMDNVQALAVRAVERADDLIDKSETLSAKDRPTLAANLFLRQQIVRSATLASFETQWAAERAKGTEIFVLTGEEDSELKTLSRWSVKLPPRLKKPVKTWRSQGDSRVRTRSSGSKFDHLFADGQKVNSDEPFQVSGDLLRWPGDTSLGARLGNVIGCRCSAIYDSESVVELREQVGELLTEGDFPRFADDLVPEDSPFVTTHSEVVEAIAFPSPKDPQLVIFARDSIDVWKDSAGKYLPARKALHTGMINGAETAAGVTRVEKPVFNLMGGGSASGKSSLLKTGQLKLPKNRLKIENDDFKKLLPEYDELKKVNDPRSAAFVHLEAVDITNRAAEQAATSGFNTVIDGTGDSGWKNLKASMDRFRKRGYRISADYVTIPTEEAVARNAVRSAGGQHGVPAEVIRAKHKAVSQDFMRAVEEGAFDDVRVWDNTTPFGEDLELIFEMDNGVQVIHNEKLFAEFLAKANE